MKVLFAFLSILSVVSAFAPLSAGRINTQLDAKLADTIFGMDLFAPNPNVNTYGARKAKNLKVGTITTKSYVPTGLTASQYNKIRDAEQKKKDATYQKNVSKAGKFMDFTDFYLKRGTGEGGGWLKSAGRGHTFAKTKYDYSGGKDDTKKMESTTASSIFGSFGKKK